MKTNYEYLKSPDFWLYLGCKLKNISQEVATVEDLICGGSFTLTIKIHTLGDVYQMLQMRRKENLP